jgi:hypothetical protein
VTSSGVPPTAPTKAHLEEWQLFSARYGVADPARWWDKQPWASRHHRECEPQEVAHRCACPGGATSGNKQCRLAVTQEDMLCDECRLWCYAVDSSGSYHPFVSVFS